jgi:drug/metabolite transporter (DMT)-like permease
MSLKTAFLSTMALIAFAGNSVLCRLALGDTSIHPASFTGIRLIAGAVTLCVLVSLFNLRNKGIRSLLRPGWAAPIMLFSYAALFSFAYITLNTGVGALILFGSVQITLVLISLYRGNHLSRAEWAGLSLACAGLVYLVLPELSKPSISGFIMMSASGIAWGGYTILGQGSKNPLADTVSNFVKASLLAVVLLLPMLNQLDLSFNSGGAANKAYLLAIASGAITSGIGYAIWYSALENLSTSQAGVMQLSVPIIAGIGGVVLAGELFSMRLAISSAMTLGGMFIVISAGKRIGVR